MDYFGILKKAWNITWKYKALWVLGLFAGVGSSGGSSGGSGSNSYQQQGDQLSGAADNFTQWASDNVLLIAIVAGVFVIIAVVFWVLSFAAQGGLVYGANEAAEGRTPSLGTSWGVGFAKWGRTFMIGFVLGLPVIVVAIVMGVLIVVTVGGGALVGSGAGSDGAGAGAAAGALGGLCCILPVFVLLIIAMSVILGIVYPLALRYGVLEDTTFGQAIKRGWGDLRAKRGAFVFWLVMLLPQFAYGVVTLIIMVPFLIPVVIAAIGEKYVMAGALFLLMMLVMLLPMSIYGTFVSSAWTVFFRQMTGLEPKAVSAPAYAPYAPPAPPVAPAPPAPPASPIAPPIEAPIVDVEPVAPAAAPPAPPAPTDEVPPTDV